MADIERKRCRIDTETRLSFARARCICRVSSGRHRRAYICSRANPQPFEVLGELLMQSGIVSRRGLKRSAPAQAAVFLRREEYPRSGIVARRCGCARPACATSPGYFGNPIPKGPRPKLGRLAIVCSADYLRGHGRLGVPRIVSALPEPRMGGGAAVSAELFFEHAFQCVGGHVHKRPHFGGDKLLSRIDEVQRIDSAPPLGKNANQPATA